jgi:anti-sigma factor ChrR (cupin superfamily)
MHADVNERVVVETQTAPWLVTADGEGACKPLDSLEAGAGTTSLVQAPAGAVFASPGGALGEEILVLDGVFEDDFGRYPAGSWLRSPHMSRHQPFSREGCTIFVKVGHLGAG